MRQELKIARAMAKFAQLAQQAGQTVETPKDIQAAATEIVHQRKNPEPYYEAEAVLLFLEKPARFAFKPCKRCNEMFGTNYRSVAYCSDNCRKKSLAKIGIRWDPTKSPEERWAGEAPVILPPPVVKFLRDAFDLPELTIESSGCVGQLLLWEDVQEKPNPVPQLPLQTLPIYKKEGSVFHFL